MLALYEQLVLRRPALVLLALALLLAAAVAQFPRIRLDASADSLLLQGDPALEYFRDVSRRYAAQEFIVITWQPGAPLLADESLRPLARLAEDLRALPGVSSVLTILDAPLLQSPPLRAGSVQSWSGKKATYLASSSSILAARTNHGSRSPRKRNQLSIQVDER